VSDPVATDVVVEPRGEILGDDLQAAIHDLDTRSARSRPIDDMQVAMTITDDFMGNTTTSGAIGALGWAIGAGAGAGGSISYSTVTSRPGVLRLGLDGAAAPTWVAINLGFQLKSTPVFVQETRARIEKVDDANGSAEVFFGLGNKLNATEPKVGCYFGYGPDPEDPEDPEDPHWWAACAVGGDPTQRIRRRIDMPPPPAPGATGWHRFRITSDGSQLFPGNALSPQTVVRYYVDDITQPVAQIVTSTGALAALPFAPIIGIRRTAGTDVRGLFVDSYQLRWETTRFEATT